MLGIDVVDRGEQTQTTNLERSGEEQRCRSVSSEGDRGGSIEAE